GIFGVLLIEEEELRQSQGGAQAFGVGRGGLQSTAEEVLALRAGVQGEEDLGLVEGLPVAQLLVGGLEGRGAKRDRLLVGRALCGLAGGAEGLLVALFKAAQARLGVGLSPQLAQAQVVKDAGVGLRHVRLAWSPILLRLFVPAPGLGVVVLEQVV